MTIKQLIQKYRSDRDYYLTNKYNETMVESDTELESMWNEFGNVPINNNDETEQDFYHWEKGTDRFEIWHWFDEKLPRGISELVF